MMYLILRHIKYDTIEDTFNIIDKTDDMNVAEDKLQGYRLIEQDKNISYRIIRTEI